MICVLPYLNSNAQIRRLRISVPMIAALLDGEKYFRRGELPPPAGDELRPLYRPRITPAADQRTPPPHRRRFSRRDWAELDQLIGTAPSSTAR
jgi:hypothetical protein